VVSRLLKTAFWALALFAVFAPGELRADEIPPGTERLYREHYEVRIGAFAHAVGSVEQNTVDINGEFVFADFWPKHWAQPGWRFLLPRLHIGVAGNTGGKTSYGYIGGLWTFELTRQFFVEAFVGGAVHDGSLSGSATQVALGCNPLFHVGGSVGYRITNHWSVMATFDHLSNGNAVLNACGRNQGINNYGARIGYAF
jgi:hypothetical protein